MRRINANELQVPRFRAAASPIVARLVACLRYDVQPGWVGGTVRPDHRLEIIVCSDNSEHKLMEQAWLLRLGAFPLPTCEASHAGFFLPSSADLIRDDHVVVRTLDIVSRAAIAQIRDTCQLGTACVGDGRNDPASHRLRTLEPAALQLEAGRRK